MPSKPPGPSVKDPEQYEALRAEGASKQKAARIANASAARGRSAVGRAGGQSWTRAELYHRAVELGVTGRSGMNKAQLVDALRNS
jgi:hypothetical protein